MQTLIDAAKAAGKWDRDAIIAKLSETTFDTPYGRVKYGPSDLGGLHQLITEKTMIAVQYQPNDGFEVVWPADNGGQTALPGPLMTSVPPAARAAGGIKFGKSP